MGRVNPIAKEACMASLQGQFDGAAGRILLAQFRRDGTRKWMNAEAGQLGSLFDSDDWDVAAAGLPVNLYARQHTFRGGWPGPGPKIWGTINCLRTVAVDVDCHKAVPDMPVHEAAERGLQLLRDAGIPLPNMIDFSGGGQAGGFYFRWLICPIDMGKLAQPERARVAAEYRDSLRGLVALLAPLGADPRAVDVGRLLRVPGSANSKYLDRSGEGAVVCRRQLHVERVPLEQLRSALPHDRQAIAVAAVPAAAAKPAVARSYSAASAKACQDPTGSVTRGKTKGGRFSPAARVAAAVERLNRHRQGLQEGHRNDGLYTYVICLKGAGQDEATIRRKATALASQFRPPLELKEFERTVASGLKAKPYKWSFRSLIERLGISGDEQKQLDIRPHPLQHNADGTRNAESAPYYRAMRRETTKRWREAAREKEPAASPKKVAPSTARRLLVAEVTQELLAKGIRPTAAAIAAKTCLSLPTVRKYQAVNDNLKAADGKKEVNN